MTITDVGGPLIVIVGETASGKSALSLRLAQQINGEILCADSRSVYRSMDIGTAKPTVADRKAVPHYGLDLVAPDQHFTVADFQKYAFSVIAEISSRGRVPILVGGTGLYIDAVIFHYLFRRVGHPKQRAKLESLTVDQLQQRLLAKGLTLPNNAYNPRHLIRSIETAGQSSIRSKLRPETLLLGLQLDRAMLRQRITARVDDMLATGLLDEVTSLVAQYGWQAEALQTTAYKAMRGYLDGSKSLHEAKTDFIQNDLRLAKRQRTWFKRNKSIHWLSTDDKLAEAVDYATTFLNK
jgi:tRNA dimethylallyltransferase